MRGLRDWLDLVAQHLVDRGGSWEESEPDPAAERQEFAGEVGRVLGPQIDAYREGLTREFDDPAAAARAADQFRRDRWREIWANYDGVEERAAGSPSRRRELTAESPEL